MVTKKLPACVGVVMEWRKRTCLVRMLLEKEKGSCLSVELEILGNQVDLVSDKHNSASCVSFDVPSRNLLALVVKQAVRVVRPGDAAHVHFKFLIWLRLERARWHDQFSLHQLLDG